MTNPTTDDMAREVWEAITGKCWHDVRRTEPTGYLCYKCKKCVGDMIYLANPPLSTSIDAWHEHIFPVMSDEQKKRHNTELTIDVMNWEDGWVWEATAMHHLQAAYAVVKGE